MNIGYINADPLSENEIDGRQSGRAADPGARGVHRLEEYSGCAVVLTTYPYVPIITRRIAYTANATTLQLAVNYP